MSKFQVVREDTDEEEREELHEDEEKVGGIALVIEIESGLVVGLDIGDLRPE
jgi:hypothetical protein